MNNAEAGSVNLEILYDPELCMWIVNVGLT